MVHRLTRTGLLAGLCLGVGIAAGRSDSILRTISLGVAVNFITQFIEALDYAWFRRLLAKVAPKFTARFFQRSPVGTTKSRARLLGFRLILTLLYAGATLLGVAIGRPDSDDGAYTIEMVELDEDLPIPSPDQLTGLAPDAGEPVGYASTYIAVVSTSDNDRLRNIYPLGQPSPIRIDLGPGAAIDGRSGWVVRQVFVTWPGSLESFPIGTVDLPVDLRILGKDFYEGASFLDDGTIGEPLYVVNGVEAVVPIETISQPSSGICYYLDPDSPVGGWVYAPGDFNVSVFFTAGNLDSVTAGLVVQIRGPADYVAIEGTGAPEAPVQDDSCRAVSEGTSSWQGLA